MTTSDIPMQPTWEFLMPQEVIIAAGYMRLSDPNKQEKGYSRQFQEQKIREYCQKMGWLLKDDLLFYDGNKGTIWRERERLQAMLTAARRHLFNVLLLYDLDRLSREPKHQNIILDELEYLGVKVIVIDPEKKRVADGTFEGDILTAMDGAFAKEENRKRRRRTRDGIEFRVVNEQKLMPGHKPLYGYRWDDESYRQKSKYIRFEPEAVVVEKIFAWKLQGLSLRQICRILIDEGIPTPTGKKDWHPHVVVIILENPFYKGKAYALRRKHEYVPGKGVIQTLRPEDEWISLPDGTVPALVTEQDWEEVQRQLQYSKARAARNNKHPEASLCRGGYVVCGRCGANFTFKKSYRPTHNDYYYCISKVKVSCACDNGPITAPIVDNAAWEKCLEILQKPQLVEQGLRERFKMQNPNQGSLAAAERQILKAGAKIQNLMEQVEEETNKEVQALLRLRIASLIQEKKGMEEERDALARLTLQWDDALEAMLQFKEWCHGRYEKIQNGETPTYKEKRDCIERMGIKVIVNRVERLPGYHPDGYLVLSDPPEITEHLGVQLRQHRLDDAARCLDGDASRRGWQVALADAYCRAGGPRL